jgi:hypothetical protein
LGAKGRGDKENTGKKDGGKRLPGPMSCPIFRRDNYASHARAYQNRRRAGNQKAFHMAKRLKKRCFLNRLRRTHPFKTGLNPRKNSLRISNPPRHAHSAT